MYRGLVDSIRFWREPLYSKKPSPTVEAQSNKTNITFILAVL